MSQKDLIKSIQNSDESAFNQIIADPHHQSIESASIKGAQIGAMRIHTIDCANTEWEACIFDGTIFDAVSLEGAFFNGCTFHNCSFKNISNFSGTAFDGCVWQKSSITDPGSDLDATELTNCQFKECILQNIHFADAILESLTFNGGSVSHVSGTAELKSVVLRSVNVDRFETSEMSLSNCTASGCEKIPAGFKACEGRRRRV